MINNKNFSDYKLENQENFLDFLAYIKNINESKSPLGNFITDNSYYYKTLDNTNWIILVNQSGIDLAYYVVNQENAHIATWEDLELKFKQILNNYNKESYVNILNSFIDELKDQFNQRNNNTEDKNHHQIINHKIDDVDEFNELDWLVMDDFNESFQFNKPLNYPYFGIKNFLLHKSIFLLANQNIVFQKSFINELINDYNLKDNSLIKKLFKAAPNPDNIRWPKYNGLHNVSILARPDDFLNEIKYTKKEENFVVNYLRNNKEFNDLLLKFYFAVKNQDPILLYELQYFNLTSKFDIIKKKSRL